MVENPIYWEKYYHGSENELLFARKYSLSDRSRYYWAEAKVQQALHHLFSNLERVGIPLTLVSQFFPQQYNKIKEGAIENTPRALVKNRIKDVLRTYSSAVIPASPNVQQVTES